MDFKSGESAQGFPMSLIDAAKGCAKLALSCLHHCFLFHVWNRHVKRRRVVAMLGIGSNRATA